MNRCARFWLICILLLLTATPATAVLDPTPNLVSLYFDLTADTYCILTAPFTSHTGYLLLTCPEMGAIGGFELGYDIEGPALVLSTVFGYPEVVDVGQPGNHIVGFGGPLICSEATLLATLSILYMSQDFEQVLFRLHGSSPSSIDPDYPTLLLPDDSLMTADLAAPPGYPVAGINSWFCEPFPVQAATWDGVKSLFR